MSTQNNDFLTKLSKNLTLRIPIYCTGYPEDPFILNYCNKYHITQERDDLLLKDKNYSVIKRIGFDAISIWDFRRSAGGYFLNGKHYVDGWGRIFKNNWYSWDGVFKNQAIIDNWKHLKLPSIEDFKLLSGLIKKFEKINLIPVFSLPGLFEKTWQSMGFIFFSKCLRKENFNLIKSIIDFFFDYSMSLLKALQKYDINIFLIADDLGYKKRLFINESLWSNLFFEKYQRIIKQVHLIQRNKSKIILHSDGDLSEIFEDIIKSGVDALHP
ncbi:MAG: hypothetical protein ACFFKA_14830, partial [Candidatus Thorarchaeota archaeon]